MLTEAPPDLRPARAPPDLRLPRGLPARRPRRRQPYVRKLVVPIVDTGYRTLRVAGGATFWLSGAGKSVFQLVGTNYEDGQIVLLGG